MKSVHSWSKIALLALSLPALGLWAACDDDSEGGSDGGMDAAAVVGGSTGGGGVGGTTPDGGPGGAGGGDTDAGVGGTSPDGSVGGAGGNMNTGGNPADSTSCAAGAFPKEAQTLQDPNNPNRRYITLCDWTTVSAQDWCFLTSTCNGIYLRFFTLNGERAVSGSREPKMQITSTSHGTLTPGSVIAGDGITGLPDATDITLNLNFTKAGSVVFRFDGDKVTIKSYTQPR